MWGYGERWTWDLGSALVACDKEAHADGGHRLAASEGVHAVEGEGQVGALQPQLQQVLQHELRAEDE